MVDTFLEKVEVGGTRATAEIGTVGVFGHLRVPHFFISYASEDAKKAGELCRFLSSLGAQYWIAPESIDPGDAYTLAIPRAIRECDVFLLLFSPASDQSDDVMSEVTLARKYKKRIVPLRLTNREPEKLEYHLGVPQWIDWHSPTGESRLLHLVEQVVGTSIEPAKATDTLASHPPAVSKAATEVVDFAASLVLANEAIERKDYSTAFRLSTEMADQDYAPGFGLLARLYANGWGMPANALKAMEWARRGTGVADPTSMYMLGCLLHLGPAEMRNLREAARWYREAAEHGNAAAQNNLGFLYANGIAVPKDAEEAVRWYRSAAEQNHASAQCNLGFLYENGAGVAKDETEALRWYRAAAAQGNPRAQFNLGVLYEGEAGAQNRAGVTRDEKEAVRWYRAAAERGDASAQNNLGVMYEHGTGITKDEKEAVRWYRSAAEQGIAESADSLRRLTGGPT